MSKNSTRKPNDPVAPDPAGPRFEDALKRLEEVVTRLEAGDLPLEESLTLYEEGIGLSRLCHAKLEEAEGRIELLMKDAKGALVAGADGRPRSVPFQADAEEPKDADAGPSDDVPF